jgi:hypothetical protein
MPNDNEHQKHLIHLLRMGWEFDKPLIQKYIQKYNLTLPINHARLHLFLMEEPKYES